VGAGTEGVDPRVPHDAHDLHRRPGFGDPDGRRLYLPLREAELAAHGVPPAHDVVHERFVHDYGP
jgi:hypothetical protein